jgi:hypothetical protein
VIWKSASVWPNIGRVSWRAFQRFVQRAAGEAQGGGGDRGAEDVERLHGDLEALARYAEQAASGHRQPLKRSRASGCGAMTFDAFGDLEARRAGVDDEGRQAARAGASPVRAKTT